MVQVSGMVTLVRPLQPSRSPDPSGSSLAGKVTLVSDSHIENAWSPNTTPSGRVRFPVGPLRA